MMKIKHLDHINMTVNNYTEAKDWYGHVFGFEEVESGTMEGRPWGILRSGEALLCFYETRDRHVPDRNERTRLNIQGINHLAFRIEDRKGWEDKIKSEKISVHYGGAYRYPHSTSWYVTDPSGWEIEVVYWDNDEVTFVS